MTFLSRNFSPLSSDPSPSQRGNGQAEDSQRASDRPQVGEANPALREKAGGP